MAESRSVSGVPSGSPTREPKMLPRGPRCPWQPRSLPYPAPALPALLVPRLLCICMAVPPCAAHSGCPVSRSGAKGLPAGWCPRTALKHGPHPLRASGTARGWRSGGPLSRVDGGCKGHKPGMSLGPTVQAASGCVREVCMGGHRWAGSRTALCGDGSALCLLTAPATAQGVGKIRTGD